MVASHILSPRLRTNSRVHRAPGHGHSDVEMVKPPCRRGRRTVLERVDPERTPVDLNIMLITEGMSKVAVSSIDTDPPQSSSASCIVALDEGQEVEVPFLFTDGSSPPPSQAQPSIVVGTQRRPPVSLRINIGPIRPPGAKGLIHRPAPRALPRRKGRTIFAEKEVPKSTMAVKSPKLPISEGCVDPVSQADPSQQLELVSPHSWAYLGNAKTKLPRRGKLNRNQQHSNSIIPSTPPPLQISVDAPSSEESISNSISSPELESLPPTPPQHNPGLPRLRKDALRARFRQRVDSELSQHGGDGNPTFSTPRRVPRSHGIY